MLEAVVRACEEQRWADALDEALAVWRLLPDPALARQIERLSLHLEQQRPPLQVLDRDIFLEEWDDLEARHDPVDLARLLAPLPRLPQTERNERLLRLSEVRDPRLARALCDWVRKPMPFLERGGLDAVLRAIRAMADPRSAPALADADVPAAMQRAVRQTAAALPDHHPTLDDVDSFGVWLDRLLRPDDVGDGEALLERIRSDPDDLEARLVYADLLTARGDPHGELILLQCTDSPTEEQLLWAHELIDAYWSDWLGDLAAVVPKDGLVFRRGFLDACHIVGRDPALLASVTGHPAWATVRQVDLTERYGSNRPAMLDLVLDDAFRALQSIKGLQSRTELARALRCPRIRHLHLAQGLRTSWEGPYSVVKAPVEHIVAYADFADGATDVCRAIPTLRCVEIRGGPITWGWRPHDHVPRTALDWLVTLQPTPLPRLLLRAGELDDGWVWQLEAHRHPDRGWAVRIAITLPPTDRLTPELVLGLQNLPPAWVDALEVTVVQDIDGSTRNQLQRAADALGVELDLR